MFDNTEYDVAHYGVHLPSYTKETLPVHRENFRRLKELGYEDRYFRFHLRNQAEKNLARKLAEEYAAKWMKKTGITLVVREGISL